MPFPASGPRLRRRTLLAGMAGLAAAAALSRPAHGWHALAEEVRAELRWAWGHYRARAWGCDQIRPLTGGTEAFLIGGRHLGLSLVEAMDTLWVTGLDAEFADALGWVETDLSFAVDGELSVFETIIRMVGGLLSAHHACGAPVLLARARELGERLLPAFATPTGMPYRFVNLATGAVRDPASNPAEIGTCLPELATLGRLTGDARFGAAAARAQRALWARRSRLDLLADAIDVETGRWLSRRATVGPPADSFYEYLWDAWDLLGDRAALAMYRTATAAILRHQRRRIGGRWWFVDVDFETGEPLAPTQDELAAFYGGLLAQGGDAAAGRADTRSWAWAQARFGVLPEGYDPAADRVTAAANALRPELADAALAHWLIDRREEWRLVARDHFLAMRRRHRAPFGYATLADVTTGAQADHCPGYWWSEQMKYYWLIFSDTPRFDYRRNYLSTEGNVLRGLRGGPGQAAPTVAA